jgi:NitT/TauT family transport system substrate-binding protein
MAHINIEFTLFSAFYSPLISLMSGGFLQAEGLEADWTVSPPGVSAVKALAEGRADVIQSAPSQAFTSLAKGETPTAFHFCADQRDGRVFHHRPGCRSGV